MISHEFDYVVLGAGMGGLSAAACLSRLGFRVAVLEKHYLAGGCCHTFDYGAYRFCADVHYVSQCGPDETIGRFLDFIGREVPFNSLDPDCIDRVVTDEVDFKIPLGWEALRRRLLVAFAEEATAINRYCDGIAQLHRQMRSLVNEVHWFDRKWSDWARLPRYWQLYGMRNWTLQDFYDRTGLSPRLQDLLAGQSGDYALAPEEIALFTHTSLVSDYAAGAFYPTHHFKHFVDTLVDAISARSGAVVLSTPVERILVEGSAVTGVVAGGEVYRGLAYISDLDPKLTVQLMNKPLSEPEQQRLTGYTYSASAYNIYLGLDGRFKPEHYGIGNWNVWYYPNGNLNRSYRVQLEGNLEHPWIFLSCPTMKTRAPGIAPPGHHVLEIATVCSYEPFHALRTLHLPTYRQKKRQVYQQLMRSVRDLIPDIDRYIRLKIYGTPTTSEHYLGQPRGNIYGAKLIPSQVGLNRLGYRTELVNLFLVGASAGYPSVPGVIANGMDVAEMVSHRPVWQSRPEPPRAPAEVWSGSTREG